MWPMCARYARACQVRYPEIHANDHKYGDYCDLFVCAWREDRRIKMQIVLLVCARWSSCKGATRKTCSKEIEIPARLGPAARPLLDLQRCGRLRPTSSSLSSLNRARSTGLLTSPHSSSCATKINSRCDLSYGLFPPIFLAQASLKPQTQAARSYESRLTFDSSCAGLGNTNLYD